MNNDKIILADCDGVLLNWEDGFHEWMRYQGYQKNYSNSYWLEHHYDGMSQDEAEKVTTRYNTSGWMMGLPPMRDSRSGVATLVENGYRFHVITAMGQDPYSHKLRMMNLENVFGKDTVEKLTIVDLNASKEEALEPYRDSGLPWIEDKAANARLGADMGLSSYLINHLYNAESDGGAAKRVDTWSEICADILK